MIALAKDSEGRYMYDAAKIEGCILARDKRLRVEITVRLQLTGACGSRAGR